MKINRAQANGIWAVALMLPVDAEIEVIQPDNGQIVQMIGRVNSSDAGKVFSIYKDGSYKLVSAPVSIEPEAELGDPNETDL